MSRFRNLADVVPAKAVTRALGGLQLEFLTILALLSGALFSISAWAQVPGPSKEDTLNFIKSKASACSMNSQNIDSSFIPFIQSDNKFSLTIDLNSGVLKTTGRLYQRISDFSENSPGTLQPQWGHILSEAIAEVPLSELKIEVTTDKDKIALTCQTGDCFSYTSNILEFSSKKEQFRSSIVRFSSWKPSKIKKHMNEISFCDSDDAKRVARAFSHLIELSGGKKSLF